MRRTPAILALLALVVAAPAVACSAVATTAHAGDAVVAPEALADSARADSGPDATAAPAGGSVDASTVENLTVRVHLPRTVAENVTQNYTVDVSGAEGNVTATWTFRDATKNGTIVQHTWRQGGNATITVTVTDESGASVTKELTVSVVEYGSTDEDGNGSNPLRVLGGLVIMIVSMMILPAILYMYFLPTVMEYLTDEF